MSAPESLRLHVRRVLAEQKRLRRRMKDLRRQRLCAQRFDTAGRVDMQEKETFAALCKLERDVEWLP